MGTWRRGSALEAAGLPGYNGIAIQTVIAYARARVMKKALRVPGDVEHQGLPLHNQANDLSKEISRLDSLASTLQAMVRVGLDLQTAVGLLRTYAGPASRHTLQSCVISTEAAIDYDRAIAKAWGELLGRPIDVDEPRLWLPLRMGGCGAASARARQFAAPWAAWSTVSSELVKHMGVRDVDHLFEIAPALGAQLQALHASLVAQGTVASISHSTAAHSLTFSHRQKYLTAYIHKEALRALRARLEDNEAAFLKSASGKSVGAFLEVPMDDRWTMANTRFATACRRRLGMPYPGETAPPATAAYCKNTTADGRTCGKPCDSAGMHQECCAPGGALIERHDRVVRCLASLCGRWLDPKPKLEQVIPELAQPVHGQVSRARLDVVVHDGVSRSLVDVVIVSPYAGDASFRRACARRDGHAARRAETLKRRRYDSSDLVPFALETGGRLGADARAFCFKMAGAAEDPIHELQYIYRAVASVLQDGLARQLQLQ